MQRRRTSRVGVVTAGGTIAASHSAASSYSDLDELIRSAEQLIPDVKLARIPWRAESSRAMTPAAMCELANLLTTLSRDYDGIVVAHGTDTLEETAYALSLQLESSLPIVLTGAMRSPYQPGYDGFGNLVSACRVAASDEIADFGPVVVFGDEIHLARYVTKVQSTRVHAFDSVGLGPIGEIVETRIRILASPPASEWLGLPAQLTSRVEVITAVAGADGFLARSASNVADGLVIAGTGGGHVHPSMAEALAEIRETGLPVIMTTRCPGGATLRNTYRGLGSEAHLRKLGVRYVDWLSAPKARLRLMVALELGLPIERAFPS